MHLRSLGDRSKGQTIEAAVDTPSFRVLAASCTPDDHFEGSTVHQDLIASAREEVTIS
jgi:hypothetical protein